MRVDFTIHPETPVARERCDRELSTRLRAPEKRGPDWEGQLGVSAICRAKPFFPNGSNGPDRARVSHVDLHVDFTDDRDAAASLELVWGLADALGGARAMLAGRYQVREDMARLLDVLVRDRRKARLIAHAGAVLGALLLLVGARVIYGFEGPPIDGVVTRHLLIGPGAGVIAVGLLALGGSAATALKD